MAPGQVKSTRVEYIHGWIKVWPAPYLAIPGPPPIASYVVGDVP